MYLVLSEGLGERNNHTNKSNQNLYSGGHCDVSSSPVNEVFVP